MIRKLDGLIGPVLLCLFIMGSASDGFAQSGGRLRLPSDWRSRIIPTVEQKALQVSVASYKPALTQFEALLGALGMPPLGAASLISVALVLQHNPQVSTRIELGYWTNNTQIPMQEPLDLSATLIPVAIQGIYRPIQLQEYLPLYVGGGFGYTHLTVAGSALDLLDQQGIQVDQKESGLTGYLLAGLDFGLPLQGSHVILEVKHLLKTFTADKEPLLELEFDGTAITLGMQFEW